MPDRAHLIIRPFKQGDRPQILELIRLNTPDFFDPSELADFEKYLDEEREEYFVAEDHGLLIGAGGINYFPKLNQARIAWDAVHPDFQGKGVGGLLVDHRLDVIRKKKEFREVTVRTSQIAFRFYQKKGFKLESVEKDYWAEGFDLYLMNVILEK